MKTYRTAKVVLQDDNGLILILKRGDTHPTQASHMDLPGGIVEDSEDPIDTLIRELKEETGIKYDPKNLKLVFALAEENDGKNAVRTVFAGKINGNKPKINLSWEHVSYEWLPIDDAIQVLNPKRYKKLALEYLKDNKVLEDL